MVNDGDDHLVLDLAQPTLPFDVALIPVPKPNIYSLAPPDNYECHEGGGFFYEDCPDVFLGRTGYGPLRIAWDTNILIDFASYGRLVWNQDDFNPPINEAKLRSQLVAFATIMHLWMIRDIRIKVPFRQISDARRSLNPSDWQLREQQIRLIVSALDCIELDHEITRNVPKVDALPVESTNDDWDRSLVLEAIETGCHVFLTRDNRLVRRLSQIAHASALLITRPTDLLQALDDAQELVFPDTFPDNHKWVHFFRAAELGQPEP